MIVVSRAASSATDPKFIMYYTCILPWIQFELEMDGGAVQLIGHYTEVKYTVSGCADESYIKHTVHPQQTN